MSCRKYAQRLLPFMRFLVIIWWFLWSWPIVRGCRQTRHIKRSKKKKTTTFYWNIIGRGWFLRSAFKVEVELLFRLWYLAKQIWKGNRLMWGSGNAQELHYIASGNRKLQTTKYVCKEEHKSSWLMGMFCLISYQMNRDEEIASIPWVKVGRGCGSHKDVFLNIKKW